MRKHTRRLIIHRVLERLDYGAVGLYPAAMQPYRIFTLALVIPVATASTSLPPLSAHAGKATDSAAWRAFVAKVKKGALTEADVDPYYRSLKKSLMRNVTSLLKSAPDRRLRRPEIRRVGKLVHYVVRLGALGRG